MKITPEVLKQWQELQESFSALSEVMVPRASNLMQDQLSRAKVLASDTEALIAKLREMR